MTLAGNMKLKNFVVIAVLAVVGGSAGLYMACSKSESQEEKDQRKLEKKEKREEKAAAAASAAALAPDAAVAQPAFPAQQPVVPYDLAPRAYDAEAIAWKDKPVSGDKIKDAAHGKPYKLNVYKDAGATHASRVKIDLNRNEKWDEKITFDKDGTITLERAPADDENYTEKYHWTGTGWMKAK